MEATRSGTAPLPRGPQLRDDAPSAPALWLRWRGPVDGVTPVASLDFEIENTTGDLLSIDASLASGAGVGAAWQDSIRVDGRTTVDCSVPMSGLGVQLVNKSVGTLMTASYKGTDGTERAVPLSARVEHEPGFDTARVRSTEHEALAGAGLRAGSLGLPRGARPTRILDSLNYATVDVTGGDVLAAGQVISDIPSYPKRRDHPPRAFDVAPA